MDSPLKIYFFGSIWGAQVDNEIVRGILAHVKTKGKVLSEHLFTDEYSRQPHLDTRAIHDRDIAWVRESNVLIGDVTAPSLGVGYELREGVILQKPILCLYRPQEGKRLSAMIDGSPGIFVGRYDNLEEAKSHVDFFVGALLEV